MDRQFEVICAVGRVSKIGRPVAIFVAYVPPSMKTAELGTPQEQLAVEIGTIKASYKNPAIYVTSDFNHRDISAALSDVDDFEQLVTTPTRGNSTIDVILSNVAPLHSETLVLPPLQAATGAVSDHRCVYTEVAFPKHRGYVWHVKMRRTRDPARETSFANELEEVDWETRLRGLDADRMADCLEVTIKELTEKHFPLVRVRTRSNEAPWITRAIRRLWKRKIRLYKKGGRSDAWWATDAELQRRIADSRVDFVDRMLEDGTGGRSFYAATKRLATCVVAPDWKVQDLFNGRPPEEICREVLEFYGGISGNCMAPLPDIARVSGGIGPFTNEGTAELLANCKKTDSRVDGNPLAHLVRRFPRAFAEPVAAIFNQIDQSGRWPTKWKTEHLTIIPKTPNPSGLQECRNISCTSIFF